MNPVTIVCSPQGVSTASYSNPPSFDLYVVRGTTYTLNLTINTGYPPTALNLTGARILFMVKTAVVDITGTPLLDNTAVISKDNQLLGGVTVTGASTGNCTLVINPSDTANSGLFPTDTPLVYTVKVYTSGGSEGVVLSGHFTVSDSVIQAT